MMTISIENTISVFYSSKKRILWSTSVFLLPIFLLVSFSLPFNIQFIWTSNIENSICYTYAPFSKQNETSIILNVVFNSFLPNLINIFLNVYTIVKEKRRNQLFIAKKNQQSNISKKRFVINCLVFFLIFFPLNGLSFCAFYYPQFYNNYYVLFARRIFTLLSCLYFSSFFLIHIITIKHINSTIDGPSKIDRYESVFQLISRHTSFEPRRQESIAKLKSNSMI